MSKKLFASLLTLGLMGAGCMSSRTPDTTPIVPETTPSSTSTTNSNTGTAASSTSLEPKETTQEKKKDLIVVNSFVDGKKIASPFSITGRARGNWYFEASFPIELRDGNNKVIAVGTAQAVGDWMTTNFVPFTAKLSFAPKPSTPTGTLVLKKDNPSGDPSKDDQLAIPVTF